MKKLFVKLALSALIIFVLATKFVDISLGQSLAPDSLLKAWEAAAVPADEFIIDGWAEIGNQFVSLSEVEGIGRKLAQNMGVKALTRPTVSEEDGLCYYTVEGSLTGGIRAIITVQSSNQTMGGSTHAGILLVGEGVTSEMSILRRKVLNMLTEGGKTGEVSIGISGSVPGRMTADTVRALCNRTVASVGGRIVSYQSDSFGTVAGANCAALGKTMDFGGVQLNLQIAARYNQHSGNTVVTLASPFLTELF